MSSVTKKQAGKSFSMRLRGETIERLNRQAKHRGQAPRTLAQRYVEEGIQTEEHPLIRFVDGAAGRRASVIGCGLDVWEIVETVRDNKGDLEGAAEYLGKPLYIVEAAINYYTAYPEDIDEWIADHHAESERTYSQWLAASNAFKQ